LLKGNFKYFLLGVAIFLIGKYLWMKPKYNPGVLAPTFSMPALDGGELALEDYRGKMVLLDFWGSWCAPCREESPNLVALYNKWNPSGLEILSVGMEQNEARWKGAIAKDGLRWKTHGSSLKRMKDPVGQLYGVREIPTKYLIDKEGYIIATNPSFEELETLLQSKLSK